MSEENYHTHQVKLHLMNDEAPYRASIELLKSVKGKKAQKEIMKDYVTQILKHGFDEYGRHKTINQKIDLTKVQWHKIVACFEEDLQ